MIKETTKKFLIVSKASLFYLCKNEIVIPCEFIDISTPTFLKVSFTRFESISQTLNIKFLLLSQANISEISS